MKNSKFFKVFMVCLTVLFVFTLLTENQASAEMVEFNLVNLSGRTMKRMYVSDTGADGLGVDILGDDVLRSGQSINPYYNDRYRYFNIRVVWTDNTYLTWSNYDLKGVWRLTLYKDGGTYYLRNN